MNKPIDQALIARIVADIAAHAPFEPYADQIPDDFAAAYDIQDKVVAMLQAQGIRSAPCGYKLAANSRLLMAHFAIDEPAVGRMFSDQKWDSPARLSANDYRSLLIEPEIMAVIGTDMTPRPGGHDRDSAGAGIDRYLPAIELVDTRDAILPEARLASIVAQNVTTEGLISGGPGLAPQDVDIDTLAVSVAVDGQVVAQTTGTAPQHPLDAVSWLANHLLGRGGLLKAGDIVMCGTHLPPMPVPGPAQGVGHVLVDMGPLGQVEFSIT